jgi:hypothetical protein
MDCQDLRLLRADCRAGRFDRARVPHRGVGNTRKWTIPWQREGSGVFDSRATATEFLDRPDCDPALAAASYRFMEMVNCCFGGIRWSGVFWPPKRRGAIPAPPAHPRHRLGKLRHPAGGEPVGARVRHPLHFTCLETAGHAVDIARGQLARAGNPAVQLLQEDAFTHQPAEPYDCAVASMCFHHFSDAQILTLLQRLRGFVRNSVLINDLRRSRLASLAARLLLTGAAAPAGVRHDALLSIRRGFKISELSTLLRQLDSVTVSVEPARWFRIAAIIRFNQEKTHEDHPQRSGHRHPPALCNAGGGLRILHRAFHPETGRTGSVSPHSSGRQNQRPLSGDGCQDGCPRTDPDRLLARFLKFGRATAVAAARRALAEAGVEPAEIAGLIVNTCTGYLCPGLSSYIAEDLGLKTSIRFQDLMGMGCGAAIPNLEAAAGMLARSGEGPVLSIAVEICSATIFPSHEPELVVSNSIFGDGAAAAVLDLAREDRPGGLARMVDFATGLFPGTARICVTGRKAAACGTT